LNVSTAALSQFKEHAGEPSVSVKKINPVTYLL